jgi:hypothetical protein
MLEQWLRGTGSFREPATHRLAPQRRQRSLKESLEYTETRVAQTVRFRRRATTEI